MSDARAVPLYDTHCHLDALDPGLRADATARAIERGVERVLVPAVDPARWDAVAAERSRWGAVRIALGVHPHAVGPLAAEAIAALASRARELGAVAIGEIGLDDRPLLATATLDRQREALDAQLEIARALDLPIVLHAVGAIGAAIEAVARHGRVRGVVHGFTGAPETARRWIALGLSIGIGPVITRPHALRARASAAELPLEHLVLETDGPEGRVVPAFPGEPGDVAEVAAALAALRGADETEIRAVTTAHAGALFG